jgi:hypothetical protein
VIAEAEEFVFGGRLYFSSVTAEVEATVLQPLAHHPYHSSEK